MGKHRSGSFGASKRYLPNHKLTQKISYFRVLYKNHFKTILDHAAIKR